MFFVKEKTVSEGMQLLTNTHDDSWFNSGVDFVLLFLLFSVLFIVFQLFFLRFKKNYLNRNKSFVQFKINGFLTEIIFSDDQSEYFIDQKIKDFKTKIPLRKSWCKDLLIQNIIDLDKNLKGQSNNKLLSIYFKLGLQGYTEKLFNSRIWYLKTKGIYYWRELNYTQVAHKIYPYLSHSHSELRSAALLAYISLSEDENPLHVFKGYTDQISYVEMLNLMHVIQRRKFQKPENLPLWLKSKDDTHVIFALKLVAHFNDLESGSIVIKLLESSNPKIRNEVIQTIGKLYLFEAEQDLIVKFFKENEENQIETIMALKEIGGKDAIDFMHYLLSLNKSAELKLAAMYALKSLDLEFSRITFDGSISLDLIKKHVKNPYLEV